MFYICTICVSHCILDMNGGGAGACIYAYAYAFYAYRDSMLFVSTSSPHCMHTFTVCFCLGNARVHGVVHFALYMYYYYCSAALQPLRALDAPQRPRRILSSIKLLRVYFARQIYLHICTRNARVPANAGVERERARERERERYR